jgi:nucleotide-binding universal stress UspA family protein
MLKAKVITIYVIDTTVIDRIAKISERENLENELRQDGSRYIKYTLALAEKERVEASSVIAKGRPYAEIIKASKDLETDLIVIGTHGRSGGERILIGSVTARVIEHSSCPILVVR